MINKKIKSYLLPLILGMAASGTPDKVFAPSFRQKPKYNPDYKPVEPNRELKEFCIRGKKVMAYSRKDAIVRLRHKKIE